MVDALGSHPMTARQMAALAPPREVSAALSALVGRGLVERRDGLRGRLRERGTTVVRLRPGVGPERGRGARQRKVLSFLAEAGDAAAVTSAELEARVPGARAALRALASRALVEVSPQSSQLEAVDGTDAVALEP